jgi:hypothetical protein
MTSKLLLALLKILLSVRAVMHCGVTLSRFAEAPAHTQSQRLHTILDMPTRRRQGAAVPRCVFCGLLTVATREQVLGELGYLTRARAGLLWKGGPGARCRAALGRGPRTVRTQLVRIDMQAEAGTMERKALHPHILERL